MSNEQEMLYFKMQLLQAEIEMQGMIAENQYRMSIRESPAYREDAFNFLVGRYGIHHNKFPY